MHVSLASKMKASSIFRFTLKRNNATSFTKLFASFSQCKFSTSATAANVDDAKKQVYQHRRDVSSHPEVEFFVTDQRLERRRTRNHAPHFVFLEGVAGSGKRDVLNRLAKIGYETGGESFIDLCTVSYSLENEKSNF